MPSSFLSFIFTPPSSFFHLWEEGGWKKGEGRRDLSDEGVGRKEEGRRREEGGRRSQEGGRRKEGGRRVKGGGSGKWGGSEKE